MLAPTVTVIRHKPCRNGFAVVVTSFLPSFAARCQRYEVRTNGVDMFLAHEIAFSDEQQAIAIFNDIPEVS